MWPSPRQSQDRSREQAEVSSAFCAMPRDIRCKRCAAREHRRNERTPALIEGEGVEPEALQVFRNEADVRAIFIVETDGDQLYETFASRPSAARFLSLSERRRAAVVEMNLLYGA